MIYAGIDPGLSGGLAFYHDSDGKHVVYPMPVIQGKKKSGGQKNEIDPKGLAVLIRNIMKQDQIALCMIEKVGVIPATPDRRRKDGTLIRGKSGQGTVSAFNFGEGVGILKGVLAALGVPYDFVRPQEWKKVVLAGMAWQGNKLESVKYVNRKYPDVNLVMPRCRKAHDGIADAICIGEYGRIKG